MKLFSLPWRTALLATALATVAPLDAKIIIDAPNDYTSGLHVGPPAHADFNLDGKLDLMVPTSSGIMFLAGNGSALQPAVKVDSGSYTLLIPGDYNRDGRPDLATRQGILLGKGDGTFQAILPFPINPDAENIVVADLNGDAIPDLVTTSGNQLFIVWIGVGNGTFTKKFSTNYVAGHYSPPSVADFNRDGKLDLAFVGSDHQTYWMRGNGDGTFSARVNLSIPGANVSAAAADFNGDGKPDLAISESESTLRVAYGKGDGTFQPAVVIGPGGNAYLLLTDLNFDGRPDLFAGEVYYLNLGSSLAPAAHVLVKPPYPLYGLGEGVDAADLNGDGWADFSTHCNGNDNNCVTAYFSRGGPTWPQFASLKPVSGQWGGQATADLNGDGRVDVVVFGWDGKLHSFLGDGKGSFQDAITQQTQITHVGYAIRTGDLNRDGKADVVVSGQDDLNHILVLAYIGNGNGSFTRSGTYSVKNVPSAMTSGDINGDGKVDVILSTGETLLGNGTGGLVNGPAIPGVSWFSSFVTSADFNGDQKLDVAFIESSTISIFPGKGDGTFGPVAVLTVNGDGSCLTVADLNKDSKMDLIAGTTNTNNIVTFLGNGNGTFQPARISGGVGGPSRIVPTDLDNDGNLDLVVANSGAWDVSILPGRGDGTFLSSIRYFPGSPIPSVLAADVDGDGKKDLIVNGQLNFSVPDAWLGVMRNISQ